MIEGLTKTESALLQALQRERLLLEQRDWVSGIILHELGNAATVIGASVELLQLAEPGSRVHTSSQERLRVGTEALQQMLTGLRVLIDSTGASAIYEYIDVMDFTREVIRDPLLANFGDAQRIRIHLTCTDRQWRLCTSLMRHALGNLLRNALRYSKQDSNIDLTISSRGGRHWMTIYNEGTKIPDQIAAHLFEPGKKTSSGGMGLGLYIAQTCVNRMDGRLVFGSTPAGTVFAIIFDEFVIEHAGETAAFSPDVVSA